MKLLAATKLVLLFLLLQTAAAQEHQYVWNGLTPGITTRKHTEKRFGESLVVSAHRELVYNKSEIDRAGQDDYLLAQKVSFSFDKNGVLFYLRVVPADGRYDEAWLTKHFGSPDVWVANLQKEKAAGVYHARRVVALLGSYEGKICVTELFVSGP